MLLPDGAGLKVLEVVEEGSLIRVRAQTTAATAGCPLCGTESRRVHSRYERDIADLPWAGRAVRWRVTVRRFFCSAGECPRKVFAERLPELAAVRGRCSLRLGQAHCQIGLALGGQAGARLADFLGMPASADTLLRRIRQVPRPEAPPPRVVGVDDWAMRRGQRYGTIVCDLERHRPIALLPDRSAETVAEWLRQHPEIEIVSRDRGDDYIKGAGAGAPQAVQVADRWHLLKNVREALVRVIDRHHAEVRRAAEMAAACHSSSEPNPEEAVETVPPESPPSEGAHATQIERFSAAARQSQARRARRLERYEQVLQLHQQSLSVRAIAKQLKLHRRTVRRYLAAGSFPERAQRRTQRQVDRFSDFLRQRWDEGCHQATDLFREIQAQGFGGSYDMVRRCVAPWRGHQPTTGASSDALPAAGSSSVTTPIKRPSSRSVSWLLLKAEADQVEVEKRFLDCLKEHCPQVRRVSELACEFATMVRQRDLGSWPDWLARSESAETPLDFRRFAQELRADEAAVKAALSLPWSNGQVEGQINRLKALKRQMYGRASFDLLEHRFLSVV